MDLRDGPEAAKQSPHPARRAGFVEDEIEAMAHVGVAPEVFVNIMLGFSLRSPRACSQAERTDAVNDAIIDCLGDAAMLMRLQCRRDAEDLKRSPGVDIF